MRELLEGLGWTSNMISILEICFYTILILSGLLALIKQLIKCVRKLVPKVKDAKTIHTKLEVVRAFLKWATKALKDGKLSDDELAEINKQVDAIVTGFDSTQNDDSNTSDTLVVTLDDEVGE